jgi:hypothetical protein
MARPVYFTMNTQTSSPWKNVDYHAQPVNLSIAVTVTGTINYSVELTYDRFWDSPDPSSWSPVTGSATVVADPVLTSQTTSGQTTINDPITGWRVTVNSVSGGSIAVKGIQAGIVG